ncbi:class F sortase [Kineococcus radiotolerans]|uniref:class F sortase n=1 Tax=Kineococcus radiotolerans TaxID=131568 RepID=UPI0006769CCB|nr:class F sortase [Kineococcus radiotolerans]
MRAPRPEARRDGGAPVPVRPRAGVRAVLACALALVGVLLIAGWWLARPAAGFGTPLPAPPAAAPAPTAPALAPGPVVTAAVPAPVGRRDAAPVPAAPEPVPVRLEVPALGVDAPVVPVGVDGAGALAVPDDPRVVGWYRWGPVPGEAGNAVLAGHVDTRDAGPGALFDLQDVADGMLVRVTSSDGSVSEHAVTARRSYPKDELPTGELFARQGPPQLVLVTCGGDFDPRTGTYEDNVVVTARA